MSEGGGGGDGGGGYPGGPTPSSTVPDQQDAKSGLPPFSSFGEMDPTTGRMSNTDGEALQSSRLLDISSWDYYGEGLSGRLLDRGDGFPMLIPQPQYRPWESKDGHHEFPGSPLNKLPSFQSQFTAFPQDQNGETVLTTLTPAPPSPNSSSSGLPSFHTLSTVPPRGYPLVPAPVQAREIPSIQQQILDERHIHLFQGAPHQQYHQLGAYQPQPQQTTLLTVVKTEPLLVTQLQSGYDHHQDIGIKMEDANSPRGYLDSRKKERRKIRASSMESSNESDGVGSSSVESSGQVAAISSTAGFKSPLACHQPNMHSEDDLHDMSDKPVKKKRKRCGECIGCQRKDNCGDCAPCRNDKSHQICKMRRCEKLTEKKHLLYLNHDYPRSERGRGRGKGRGGASYRKLHQTPRNQSSSPNVQINGSVDSNNMMTSIPDHNTGIRGETKLEPQVTQTNLPPITGSAMPLYSSPVQPVMDPTTGFPTPLREHRFPSTVWQPTPAPPDPNGTWTPQGQFIQQIPTPQIEEIRYPQYAVAGYPQATPVVGYQQNSFMQTNGNLYNGTPQPQPSPHSMHNGNSRSTPTLNGNMEYVDQSPRPTEYMNGTYPHSNQPDVMAPPTSSTPTSRCGSAQLENGEGKYTNPPTPTTPSNQGNAMPGYPHQIPPQSLQSSRSSSGYPGQVHESTDRGNKGDKHNENKELWSSSPRPSENNKDIQKIDNQMHKNSDSWVESRSSNNQGNVVWSVGNEVSTTQHQSQDSWPQSPQQHNQSRQQEHQQYQHHQMNQNQMQHPQKSPQTNLEEQQQQHQQQQMHHQKQSSPQMHQPPTSTQSQHLHMQHSPLMSPHQMQQQQQQQQQQQGQIQQGSQTQQSEQQMHQQRMAQMHHAQQQSQVHQQQTQVHHQQQQQQQPSPNHQQPLQIQSHQPNMHHQQLPSPVNQQHHAQQSQMTHHNVSHHGNQAMHMMQHQSMHHHQSQMMMNAPAGSPQHREMWSGQPNSRPPSQNPPEPWPNEANNQLMWANDKKPNQFNERAELNNRLKTMILNKQQQEIKKGHEGVYQDQKNYTTVSNGNFLAQGHHPQKLVSEGGGYRSRGSYINNGLYAMENIVNSVKYPESYNMGCNTSSTQSAAQTENFLQRMTSSKYYQVSSETQTNSPTPCADSSPIRQTSTRHQQTPSPQPPVKKVKQEPMWEEKACWTTAADFAKSPFTTPQLSPCPDVQIKKETEPSIKNHTAEQRFDRVIKEEKIETHLTNEYEFNDSCIKSEHCPKLTQEQLANMERLKAEMRNDLLGCDCFPPDHIPSEPGPFYTHLGCAKSLEELGSETEKRTSLTGKALRIEKIIFTGKEGKTTAGCPMGKWVLRRGGPEEKMMIVVKNRKGHSCAASWIVVVVVAWDGVPTPMADDLYGTVTDKLKNYGVVTSRRCGVNEPRTCACQGLDNSTCGASFSFGCSWSMYYNGCKFARSKTARKFKLSVKTEEKCMEDKLQTLATHLSPLYKTMAPESFSNMTIHEEEAVDCRLGLLPGRPWSGVTACFDFCAHAHRDIHNMNNGCTTVVTLTKHRGLGQPEDEQLHVLPLYIMDETDESGSKEGFLDKVKTGAIQPLNRYPCEVRTRQTPLESCRKMAKKRKDEREHAKRALAYKMSLNVDYSKATPTSQNNLAILHSGASTQGQPSYPTYTNASDKNMRCKDLSSFHQQGEPNRHELSHMSPFQRVASCPPSPFRSPLSVVTQSPGPAFNYSSPPIPDSPGKQDRAFSPAASPNSVFRRPVGRPPSRSSNPATPQPNLDSTYLKPVQDKLDSPYSHMESDRNYLQQFSPHHSPNYMQNYSPNYGRDPMPMSPGYPPNSMTAMSLGSKGSPYYNVSSSYNDFHSAPSSPVNTTANLVRPKSTYPNEACQVNLTPQGSPVLKCASVSTQCSPSRSPFSYAHAPSPSPSQSSGYWSGESSYERDSRTPYEQFSPTKWSPYSPNPHSPSHVHPAYTPTSTTVSVQSQSPSFQRYKTPPEQSWKESGYYSINNQPIHEQSWKPNEGNTTPQYQRQMDKSIDCPNFSPEGPMESPNKQWGKGCQTPPWNCGSSTLQSNDVEPQNLLGSITDFSNNEECFTDPNIGGVAIALTHGAVLFEVAKHELHATTALKTPNRFQPTRISLVFYQHRNLNKADHGRGEWKEKQRCKKELAEKNAAPTPPVTHSVSTQSLHIQTEPQSIGVGTMEAEHFNYYQSQSPTSGPNYPTLVPSSTSSSVQLGTVPTTSAWGNLFPLHPSVVQSPYQESETLG